MQVYDVLRTVEFVSTDQEIALGARPIHLLGHGAGAYLAYLAAALEPRLATIELASPLPDPEPMLAERRYAPPASVPGMLPLLTLPGLARHCTLEDLLPLFAGRVVRR